jgi:hypothetical protein
MGAMTDLERQLVEQMEKTDWLLVKVALYTPEELSALVNQQYLDNERIIRQIREGE